ncbi:ATP synthase subunit I [Immundisolibacter sp.]|uniref:ATP synthase subunit I n=1 Tax=Immundisolibacter sp. TaxID=1934948 RepID=UPI003567BEB2
MSEQTGRNSAWADADDPEQGGPPWRVLTATEAQALRIAQPALSPWWVVRVQGLVGLLVALGAAAIMGRMAVLWSALYGAAAIVLPAAVMARGLGRRLPPGVPTLGVARLMVWEAVKVGLTVAMLAFAPRVITPLSWPALLLAVVVCLNVYWVALLWRGR